MAADESKTKWFFILCVVVSIICIYAILIALGIVDEPSWMYTLRHWDEEL